MPFIFITIKAVVLGLVALHITLLFSLRFPSSLQSPTVAFVKAQKSNAYFKRFQIKFKRRREGKTDYCAQIRMINQDKNKYNTPKYRFIVTGEDFSVEPVESRRPFCAFMDVGLVKTTTGNRVFGAFKGALDSGLDIPHGEKRFAGFGKENKQLDCEVHRNHIYGGHVAAYMRTLAEHEPEKYQSHFSEYIKKGIGADDVEEMFKKVHAAIRADPTAVKSGKEPRQEHILTT